MLISASPELQPATSGGASALIPGGHDIARRSYVASCAMEKNPTFPPSAHSLCLWIAGLANAGHTKLTTIKLYLTGLRSYRVDLGIPDLSAFEDPQLQRILRGIKIFHAARETMTRE